MATEAEKKQHRCCFVGHRPEKLSMPPAEVKEWLRKQISQAVADGYVTFITGMSMGVDIWAGQIVAELKHSDPSIHLIAAVPWPGFSARWHDDWKAEYQELLKQVDLVKNVRSAYSDDVFKARNEWMVDHSTRLIGLYNRTPGGTRDTLNYALQQNVKVILGGSPEVEAINSISVLPGRETSGAWRTSIEDRIAMAAIGKQLMEASFNDK